MFYIGNVLLHEFVPITFPYCNAEPPKCGGIYGFCHLTDYSLQPMCYNVRIEK
jgi:hypothetical protein